MTSLDKLLFASGFPKEDSSKSGIVKTQRARNAPKAQRASPDSNLKYKNKGKKRERESKRLIGQSKKKKSKRSKKKARAKGKKMPKKQQKAKRRLRNRKKNRKRQRKNYRQENSNCKNLTCLNDVLEVLKVDKDTVQNFIQQNRRLKSRLDLAGLKQFPI